VNSQSTPTDPEGHSAEYLSPDEIRDAGFVGVRWAGMHRVVSILSLAAAMVALARLLTPADFGHAVVAFFVIQVAGAVAHEGVSVPLVRRETVTDSHLEAAALLGLGQGILLGLLTLLAGWAVAPPVFGDETAALVELAAPVFLFGGMAAVGQAMLQRRLDFARLAWISTAGTVCAPVVSVTLAATGTGASALVLGPLAGAGLSALLTLASVRLPRPRWRDSAGRELASFGLPTMGSGLLHVGWLNIDYAVVAARLDAALVGFYWRAYTLGVQYHRALTGVLVSLALPLYSRTGGLQNRLALRQRLVGLQALIVFPLLGGLILLAPFVVPFVLGEPWERAVVPTQILAVAGVASAIQAGTGPLILALGRPGALLVWNLGSVVGLGVLTYAVAPLGLVPLACGVTAFWVVRVAIGQELMLRRIAGTAPGELWRSCLPAAVSTAGMLAVGAVTLLVAELLGAPEAVRATAAGFLAVSTYLAILAWGFPRVFADLRTVISGILTPARPERFGLDAAKKMARSRP
jgi:lipopolysaccharide exporter